MKEKKRNPFKLKDFRGINPRVIAILEAVNIKNTDQMLTAGCTRELRSKLVKETDIPGRVILELVKLSDLARLPGVKGIRARLYFDAGVDSVEKMAAWEPASLLEQMKRHVEQTGFEGIPPLPKEVSSTIANARKLKKVVMD